MSLNNGNKEHIKRANEFCKRHEAEMSHHKCKPIWLENGDLDYYRVIVNHRGSAHVKPRND